MTTTTISSDYPLPAVDARPIPYERLGFSWGAAFAGLATAVALNVLFAEIARALNLSILDSHSDQKSIAVGNAIAWVISGLIALFVGAWVAGRMASARTRLEGGLHGLAIWGAGAVVMLLLAFGAAGAIGAGMLSVVGSGLEGMGKIAAVAAPSSETIREELGEALDRAGKSAATAESGPASQGIAERSKLADLAMRRFNLEETQLSSEDQRDMVQLMASQLGISNEAAAKALGQWDAVWKRTLSEYEAAKTKARQAAEEARVLLASAAGWAAIAMVLSALAALLGGAFGTRCRIDWAVKEGLIVDRSLPMRQTVTTESTRPLTAARPMP